MTTKELVQLHTEGIKRDGVFELSKAYTRKMFREELNKNVSNKDWDKNINGHDQWKNGVYTNRKRPYGDYLYFQDRDMFENNYRLWLIDIKNKKV